MAQRKLLTAKFAKKSSEDRKEKRRRSQRKSAKAAEEEVSEFLVLGSRLWF
jgi:hypothetical protein